MRKVEFFVANPAGNITIFVTSPAERSEYQEIAKRLLEMEELGGEQVAFIKEGNRMEMCGLEFCGNASRSFALWYAKNRLKLEGDAKVTVDVSGTEHPIDVEINTKTNYTKIEMPKPKSVRNWREIGNDGAEGVLVDLGGIMHLVLWNVPASAETFEEYKKAVCAKYDPPAMGVMFIEKETLSMVPVVYVRDVDTTYFEGSCGSGSVAAAVALACDKPAGSYSFELSQPAGKIVASVIRGIESPESAAVIEKVFIEGPVELGTPAILNF